jgi:hypothetical protein
MKELTCRQLATLLLSAAKNGDPAISVPVVEALNLRDPFNVKNLINPSQLNWMTQ